MGKIKATQIHHDLFLLNILLIGLIVIVVRIISHYFPVNNYNFELLLPQFIGAAQPKPLEKAIFFISAIFIPIFLFAYIVFNRKPVTWRFSPWDKIVPLLLGLGFFISFFRSDWTDFLFKGISATAGHSSSWLVFLFLISLILIVLLHQDYVKKYHLSKSALYSIINWTCFLSFSIYIVFAWRLSNINSADHSFRSVMHLDAILYSLSQVVGGKTILIDLPSQYGLFPELLAPIFKLIGLSVFKFSLVMASLQMMSLAAIFYVLTKLIKSQALVFLGGFALIVLTFENQLYFAGFYDPYYQYYPIRFFCPAISLLVFYWFCKKKSVARSVVVSVTSSVAVIWNLDSGLFIFLVYSAYLSVRYLLCYLNYPLGSISNQQWERKEFLVALIAHGLIFIAIIFSFGLYLQIRTGQPINFNWLYSYQMVFYKLGYGMLPLPRKPHPWMVVMAVYIYGLIFSLNSFKYKLTPQAELIFYLSALGIGLFTYYEGRAHVANLFKVMWPAIIISLFFADQIIRSSRLKLINSANLIFPTVVISILLLCTTVLLANITTIYMDFKYQWLNRNNFQSPLVFSELQFIKENTNKGQACLLLIKNQANYYAETGLVSPIKGPGLVETMLKSDVAYMSNQIKNTPPQCVLLGQNESEFNPGFNYDELFKNYGIVKKNNENTIQLLQPK